MGYACPVCEEPQADAGHLANHLAFTAITSSGDHEEWLDEHAPEWGQLGETELAENVAEYAEETEFPQVFEESGVEDHAVDTRQARARGSGELDEEAASILAEARELTEQMESSDDEDETE
ncbi:hypothetical protein BRC91_03125 [Halobacteriales archaeon QS_4_62_28]|nr:MAG: hypothetical protein BRC91_03125 [Halobacteriales archaeon QS_4_62_28]